MYIIVIVHGSSTSNTFNILKFYKLNCLETFNWFKNKLLYKDEAYQALQFCCRSNLNLIVTSSWKI